MRKVVLAIDVEHAITLAVPVRLPLPAAVTNKDAVPEVRR